MKTILLLLAAVGLQAQTLTQINGTDMVSGAPTVLNGNFNALNAGKLHYAGTYAGGTTYNNSDVVLASGIAYISIQAANTGNTPASSALWWTPLPVGISLASLSATAPLAYNNSTGVFSMPVATGSVDGYISHIDWTTFNGKQPSGTYAGVGNCTSGQFGTGTATGSTQPCAQVQYSQLGGSVPTWNQNTTGTAASLSAALPTNLGGTLVTTPFTGIRKANSASADTAAVAGTDYIAPGGNAGTPSAINLANATNLPHSALPALVSGDIPNNAANTTGNAAQLQGGLNSCSGQIYTAGGTIAQYTLVVIGTGGTALTASTGGGGIYGVAQAAATNGNPVFVCETGYSNLIVDGTTVLGDLITPSTTTGGQGHDSGLTSRSAVSLQTGVVGPVTTLSTGSGSTSVVSLEGINRTGRGLTSGLVTGALGFTPLNPANNLSDLAAAATARTNLGLGTAAVQAGTSGALVGTTDTQTLTNKTLDGVSPSTMAFLDATSSIQTQINSKQASLGFTAENVANKDAASGYAGLTAGSLLKAAEMPAFTGDCTTSAGAVAITCGTAIARTTLNTNAQTGTSYTLLVSDNGKVVTFNNASAVTLTVPSGLGAGFNCLIIQLGAGTVTPTASSTTINQRQLLTKTAGQFAVIALAAYIADTFAMSGDLQ